MNKKLNLVALGASAGGLEALSDFISSIRTEANCAYVVVQHLSPNRTSLFSELLSRQTKLPVEQINQDIIPKINSIYIKPPGRDVIFKNGKLVLEEPQATVGPQKSINKLMSSMSVAHDIFPIAIILSGTGSDGASGLASIKSTGGLTIVQDPSSAKHKGMPLSSIYTDAVDYILEPKEIASNLPDLIKDSVHVNKSQPERTEYFRVINVLRSHTGLDLTHYKPATIKRRIQRRVKQTGCRSMRRYAEFIEKDTTEVQALLNDVLIPVTYYFRDKKCFDALRKELYAITERFKSENFCYRVWVPGCASGEEAYSIAIILEEVIQEKGLAFDYHIFATDVDEQSLNIARSGIYSVEKIKDISKDVVNKYFEVNGEQAKVKRLLRDKITFSRHNLIQDPPFSKLNLISCRNLLIYFKSLLQKHVFEVFHYALSYGGLLFLGQSETTSESSFFDIKDRENRIYVKNSLKATSRALPFMHFPTVKPSFNEIEHYQETKVSDIESIAYKAIALHQAQNVIVINRKDELIFISEQAKSLLSFKSHQPSLVIYDLVPDSMRAELKAQIFKTRRNKMPNSGVFHTLESRKSSNGYNQYKVHVLPIIEKQFDQLVIYIITRQFPGKSNLVEASNNNVMIINELQQELSATHESLQTVIDELENANEELQTSNEELQSTNEELQSANEELQTTNEELQSSNEEILTVNDELNQKNQEIDKLHTEFQNLYRSSGIPYIVLDRSLNVISTYNNLESIMDFSESIVGSHLSSLNWKVEIKGLKELVDKTLTYNRNTSTKMSYKNEFYKVDLNPYLSNKDNKPLGVILSFSNITDIENKNHNLKLLNTELEMIFNISPNTIIAIDRSGIILQCSNMIEKTFGYSPDWIIGKKIDLLMPDDIAKKYQGYIDRYPETNHPHFIDVSRKTTGKRSDDKLLPIEIFFSSFNVDGSDICFLVMIKDISKIVKIEEEAAKNEKNASIALNSIKEAVIRLNKKWQVVYFNHEAERYMVGPSVKNTDINEVLPIFCPINGKKFIFDESNAPKLLQSQIAIHKKNKQEKFVSFKIHPIEKSHSDGDSYILVLHDVTEREELNKKILWKSKHDNLTGLQNRSELIKKVRSLLNKPLLHDQAHILLYLDLDQFKVVNDTVGHLAGDELLIQVSLLLSKLVRADDVYRVGGDEFCILLDSCVIERADYISKNIIESLKNYRFSYNDKIFRIGVSIGMARIIPPYTETEVLSMADNACYKAKDNGRGCFYYADNMTGEHDEDIYNLSLLIEAVENQYFQYYFQKIHAMNDKNSSYWELLLRLKMPDGEIKLPGSFLPVGERFNYAQHIDEWVFNNLAFYLKEVLSRLPIVSLPKIAINISASSLTSPNFTQMVISCLNDLEVSFDRFCIEVTETVAIQHFAQARETLLILKEKGIKIALDDFGSGMASFNYIKELPLDIIKIDGSFIGGMVEDPLYSTIVQATKNIAEVLDCTTVAEQVETKEQFDKIKSIGIDYCQGFYLSNPLSLTDFLKKIS